MTHSDVYHSAAGRAGNVATPHAEVEGHRPSGRSVLSDNTNPAGGVVSGAEDIAKWLIVQLDSGRLAGGSPLFSPASTRQLWREVTPEPIGEPVPGLEHLRPSFYGYALGVETRDYRGKQISRTLAASLGTSLPRDDPRASARRRGPDQSGIGPRFQRDRLSRAGPLPRREPPDYIGIYGGVLAQNRSKLAQLESSAASERDSTAGPSLPPTKYVGTYRDTWYGDVSVTQEGAGLVIRMMQTPGMVGDLRHWQHDTFIARWRDRELRADAFVTFALNPDGSIDQVKMAPTSPAVDFSFDFQDLLLRPVVK